MNGLSFLTTIIEEHLQREHQDSPLQSQHVMVVVVRPENMQAVEDWKERMKEVNLNPLLAYATPECFASFVELVNRQPEVHYFLQQSIRRQAIGVWLDGVPESEDYLRRAMSFFKSFHPEPFVVVMLPSSGHLKSEEDGAVLTHIHGDESHHSIRECAKHMARLRPNRLDPRRVA